MARSKKQFLQNVHTTKMYSPEVIAGAELKDGEIAVFQNTEQPSLGIKVGDNTYAQFKDSEAVTAEINSAKTALSTTIGENTAKISQLEAKFNDYATKTYVNDALTGVTGTGPDSIVTKLDTAEKDITNLKQSASTLNDTVVSNKNAIDNYIINGLKISEKPVLTGENVLVGGNSENSAKTLNATIAEAKEAGTTASKAITTLRGGYNGTIKDINDSVTTNTSDITKLKTDVTDISSSAKSAIQTITVTYTGTNKITATKAEGSTEVVLNFDNMVIDCGEF